MGLRDRVHEWQWRARNGIGYEQLKAIRKETMEMLGKRDIKGLKGLLDTYAGSYDIPEEIATGIAREKFILTPEDAADKDIRDMMESLKTTRFMQQEGSLASLPVEEANGIHGMLAMHVFMLDAYVEQHPGCGIPRPEPEEVDAARRILDRQYEEKAAWQLCRFILVRTCPSDYVMHRYGLADDFNRYSKLNDECLKAFETGDKDREKELTEAIGKMETALERKSEKALDSIEGARVPDEYLKELDDELGRLAGLVWDPRRVEDCYGGFLEKHGIRADSPVPELEKQIEEAYRSLDDRIVRLCGRRPYAEDLFSAKKRQSEAREGDRKHAPHLPRLPPKQQSSGGMKPAF